MTRITSPLLGVLTCALVCVAGGAKDPPKNLSNAERLRLVSKAKRLGEDGITQHRSGNYRKAVEKFQEAVAVMRQAYPKEYFPNGHTFLGQTLTQLAFMYHEQGKYTEAEPLYKEALGMFIRDAKGGDNFTIADTLNHMANLCFDQGKWTEAEPLYKDALAMRQRLARGDNRNTEVAMSLHNLGYLYRAQGKFAEAEPLFKEALEIYQRRYNKVLAPQGHRDTAECMTGLAALYRMQGKLDEAESLYKGALEMRKRLHAGADHPDLARSLNNVAAVYWARGQLAEAEPLYKEAHEMQQRLFKYDHQHLARGMHKLARLYHAQGKLAEAEPLYKGALGVSGRYALEYARQRSESDSINLLTTLPLYRDDFLSLARVRAAAPGGYAAATDYAAVWAAKGMVARVYEQRQLQARAAADPSLTKGLAELAEARQRRAELLLARAPTDPIAARNREAELKAVEGAIAGRNEVLVKSLPAAARVEKLNAATSADLQKALPPDAAVVDFVRYAYFHYDKDRPANEKETHTLRYLAFVVTRDAVALCDLDTAANTDAAVSAWRAAITSGKEIPVPVPARVRELAWQKVRKELPAGVKTVYVSPDGALSGVPWGALPGDRPGTILLEDFAVATIPHAPFLLDKLWPQDTPKNPPTSALVTGGVKYDAEPTPPAPNPGAVASRGDPLLKPDQKVGWSFLDNTVGEANGVAAAAVRKKLTVTRLDGEAATTSAVLAALPKAKVAHFATHGFFADATFRSVFQLDEQDYKKAEWGERVGLAAKNPLLMTGLVFAGANNPKTPGRGILTGEQLIDLDLGGLELAVLSACETGLGDQAGVAGGEGVYGLQRAFHYAGTRDVVASLWKVPDAPTAALMALFYQNLWEKGLPPTESLRQAQLEIFRNPQKIPELAKGFRGKFEEVAGTAGAVAQPVKDGKAHPLLWAAFTLSGPGR